MLLFWMVTLVSMTPARPVVIWLEPVPGLGQFGLPGVLGSFGPGGSLVGHSRRRHQEVLTLLLPEACVGRRRVREWGERAQATALVARA